MNYFFNLIYNENVKIYKRPLALILFGLLIVMNLLITLVVKYVFTDLDFTFWEYLNISTFLIFVLNFICVIIAGDIVSNEFSAGTIKLLLIRPANRLKVLFAKYSSVVIFILLTVTIHFVSSFIFAGIFFYSSIFMIDSSLVLAISTNYFFGFIEIIIVCTFAMTLSVLTRSSVFSVSLPIFLIMSVKIILEVMAHFNMSIGKYLLFSNTNLSQYFTGQPPFEGMTLGFSLSNITVHMICFILISSIVFTKTDISV